MESFTTAGSDQIGVEVNEEVRQDGSIQIEAGGQEQGFQDGINQGETEELEGVMINAWSDNDSDFLPFIEQEKMCLNLDSDHEWDEDNDTKKEECKSEEVIEEQSKNNESNIESDEYMDVDLDDDDDWPGVIFGDEQNEGIEVQIKEEPIDDFEELDEVKEGQVNEESIDIEEVLDLDDLDDDYNWSGVIFGDEQNEGIEVQIKEEHHDDFEELDEVKEGQVNEESIDIEDVLATPEESIDVEEVIATPDSDNLIEHNIGQPVHMVSVKDEVLQEDVKKFVKVKNFPWWPAFYTCEDNRATFLNNQIGYPLEVRDFTEEVKEWIINSFKFSNKKGSSKNAFLCDTFEMSNM